MNAYGAGHVNMYNSASSDSWYHQAYDYGDTNHTGGMAYYSSADCGYGSDSNQTNSGCTTDYNSSEVKYVVDAWASAKFTDELKIVDGYSARLAQKEELRTQFYPSCSSTAVSCTKESTTPDWLYNSNYYWTMSPLNSSTYVWLVYASGNLNNGYVLDNYGTVRPVINVYKSKL